MEAKPAYSLKSFHFKNFKGIVDLQVENLPDNAHWIFLTGENGFGKTSILQGIATSLVGIEDHTFKYFKNDTVLDNDLHGEKIKSERTQLDHLFPNVGKFDNLACYGSARLNTYKESSGTSGESNSITLSLYDTTLLLENIEYQLSRWSIKKDKDKEFEEKYNYVTKLLKELLHIHSIRVDFKTDKVYYIEKDDDGNKYEELTSDQLAAGYRSIIAMVGDMILRLFRSNVEVNDPAKLKGIVIIDELELHFHPKWQKRLPEILTHYFPLVQFIASTHSPIPLLGAPKGSVFLTVRRNQKEGISIDRLMDLEQEISKLTPNLLLNSPIFSYAEVFSSSYKRGDEIYTADTAKELDFDEQLEAELQNNLSPEKKEELRRLLNKK